jgi:photosystem II stability/assembly factor-like uncharacterized protein
MLSCAKSRLTGKKLVLVSVFAFTFNSAIIAQWFQVDSLPQYNSFSAVEFTNKDTGWAVGSYGTIIKTTNSGIIWILQDSLTYGHLHDIKFIDEQIGIIVGGINVSGQIESVILKTTDSGMNWFSKSSGTGLNIYAIAFSDFNNSTVVGEFGNIRRTTDGGETWSFQNAYVTSNLYGTFFIDSLKGFIVGGYPLIPPFDPYTILKTVNAGATWSKHFYNKRLTDIYFTDSNNGFIAGEQGTILKTTNGGGFWETKRSSSEYQDLNSVFCIDSNIIWTVGNAGTILKSIDSGNSWDLVSSGTTNDLNDIYFIDKDNGWIVGDDGIILYTKNGGVTSTEPELDIPIDFLLSQNYPNPFNPSTVISFHLPVSGNVTLKVYDILGNEVTTLVNEEKTAGNYNIEFNAEKYCSGVYFYTMRAGNFIETKKLILLK